VKTPKEVVSKSGTRAVAIVPARGGSRRVPRKNLSIIRGKTLVRRALETAVAAGCFDAVCLSSDDEEILAEAEDLSVHVVLRPPELAGDDTLAYDVVVHALGNLERGLGRFGVVAVVQATSPFTTPDDLAGAVALLDRTGAPSVVSVGRIEASEHPLKLKVLDGDRLRPYLEDDRLLPS
jgi:N-acylneuraminate cytidylyltransferase